MIFRGCPIHQRSSWQNGIWDRVARRAATSSAVMVKRDLYSRLRLSRRQGLLTRELDVKLIPAHPHDVFYQ